MVTRLGLYFILDSDEKLYKTIFVTKITKKERSIIFSTIELKNILYRNFVPKMNFFMKHSVTDTRTVLIYPSSKLVRLLYEAK